MNLVQVVGFISSGIAICVSGYALYEKLLIPRLQKTKHKKLYTLIKQWFDEIDQNLDAGLNLDKLYNYEKHISDFIRDNNLDVPIRCSNKFINNYLKRMGIKKEYRKDKNLFNGYSRNAQGAYVDLYWIQIQANFYKFHSGYTSGSKDINFADIEEPVKFLKRYWGIKE